MSQWVALLLAIVGGAIAAYTTILLVAGGLLGVGWLWVFGDDPWPRWSEWAIMALGLGGSLLAGLLAGLAVWRSSGDKAT